MTANAFPAYRSTTRGRKHPCGTPEQIAEGVARVQAERAARDEARRLRLAARHAEYAARAEARQAVR
jgi:hypothetical protein